MAPPPAKKAKTTPTQISGDSLEEDFVLEDDFAPLSDDERDEGEAVASPDAAAAAELHDDSDDVHRPLPASDDEEGEAGAATTSKEKKRKAGASEGGAGEGQPASKKKGKDKKVKDNSKVKEKKQLRVELDIAQAEGMGLLPPAPLADRLAEKQKKALPKVSEMELDDIRLPGELRGLLRFPPIRAELISLRRAESYLVDTSATTSRSNLEAFIRASFPTLPTTLAKPPKKEGSPRLLVLAGAALRVADLCRYVCARASSPILVS